MSYECGYCGKKYDTITERARCELLCAAKAQDKENEKKKNELLKSKEAAFEVVKVKYEAFKKSKAEAEKALEDYNKVYGTIADEEKAGNTKIHNYTDRDFIEDFMYWLMV